ncbi:hypothetical protein [Lentilactobacillus kisonensis]|uniref:hypothetical protein n=1 Tax=Lentilactobacillus kisonensis TaxID=481722 RepID=UPI001FB33B4F|nr:hypothetical protein [Lentilactobacillus kisonensis]
MGGSNIVALDAYHKFLRVPLNVLHDSEYHMALMQSTRLNHTDCAVVISHTGNDSDTLLLADSLKKQSRSNDCDYQLPRIAISQLW